MAVEVQESVAGKTVALLLRGLAYDVEANPALAAKVLDALVATGILDDDADALVTENDATLPDVLAVPEPNPDLLGLYAARIDLRTHFLLGGLQGVRTRLEQLPIAALRRIIQVRQLDPEKVTTKLRSTSKLIDFICDRVGVQVERERELARAASWML